MCEEALHYFGTLLVAGVKVTKQHKGGRNMTQHATVRINKDIKSKLEELAKSENRSLANTIVNLVNKAYEQMKEEK